MIQVLENFLDPYTQSGYCAFYVFKYRAFLCFDFIYLKWVKAVHRGIWRHTNNKVVQRGGFAPKSFFFTPASF